MMITDDEALNMVDIERACLLAEMAGEGVGITLRTSELRFLIDAYHRQQAQLAQARDVIERVEWLPVGEDVYWLACPWCTAVGYEPEHSHDCPRQAALAAMDGEGKP